MNQQIAVPTNKPGEVYIPALGKTFQQIELREDDVYDTILLTAALQSNLIYTFWRDIQNKDLEDCNLPNPSRIQSGDEVAIFRIGLHMRESVGNTLPAFNDYRKVVGAAHLEVVFNRRPITNGPIIKYPSGLGMGGFSDETGATAVSIGVPSIAASPTLFVPQQLKDDDDVKSKLKFLPSDWISGYVGPTLSTNIRVTLFLHGVMKNPLGK